MRTWVRALALLVATLMGITGLVDSASAAGVPPPIVEIATVPPLPGVRFVFDGVRYTANEQGLVRLSLNTPQPATHRLSLVDVMMHQQRRDLTFVRWWYAGNHDQDHRMAITGIKVRRHVRIEAAFRATYKVSYSFVDPAQGPVDHERIKRVEFYGDNGQMVAGDGSGTLRLVGIEAKMSSGTARGQAGELHGARGRRRRLERRADEPPDGACPARSRRWSCRCSCGRRTSARGTCSSVGPWARRSR